MVKFNEGKEQDAARDSNTGPNIGWGRGAETDAGGGGVGMLSNQRDTVLGIVQGLRCGQGVRAARWGLGPGTSGPHQPGLGF